MERSGGSVDTESPRPNPLEISENLEQFHSDNRASVSTLAVQLPSSPTFDLSSELSKHLQKSKTTVLQLKELQEYFGGSAFPANDVPDIKLPSLPEIKLPSPKREEEKKAPVSPWWYQSFCADVPEIKLPSPKPKEEQKAPDSPVANPRSRPGSEPVSPLPILACPWAFPVSPELRSPRETNSPRPFQNNARVVPEQEEMKTEE